MKQYMDPETGEYVRLDKYWKNNWKWLVYEKIVLPILFLIFVAPWMIPRRVWKNRKVCPYFDQPYGKCGSLLIAKIKPCRLGDAKEYCFYFNVPTNRGK